MLSYIFNSLWQLDAYFVYTCNTRFLIYCRIVGIPWISSHFLLHCSERFRILHNFLRIDYHYPWGQAQTAQTVLMYLKSFTELMLIDKIPTDCLIDFTQRIFHHFLCDLRWYTAPSSRLKLLIPFKDNSARLPKKKNALQHIWRPKHFSCFLEYLSRRKVYIS